MHIIHWPTTEPLTVWHLHFICILESGWFRSHISFFDKLPCQKWGRFAFSLSRSDSGCVAREAAPSGDRKPFVTDDWVNRLVLINILIGALPPWTFGFFLFAQLSPVVSALFWLRASCVCFSTSTQRHAWLELCKGWFNGGPSWIDRRCSASPRDDLRSYHPESTEFQMFSLLVPCAIFPMTVDESDGIFGLVCFMTELITACGYCKNVFLARSSPWSVSLLKRRASKCVRKKVLGGARPRLLLTSVVSENQMMLWFRWTERKWN